MERGLYQTRDASLLFRSLDAVKVFTTSQKASKDLKSLSEEEDKLARELQGEVVKDKKPIEVHGRGRAENVITLGDSPITK